MAIFIVDQFSLNTDLPLDIRYVPDGGSYNDVSAYWYPGMQVYQTSDQTIWYADNSLNWHPISEGTDASVAALYQLFTDLSTYTYNQVNIINASIGRIDGSINNIYSIIGTLDASIVDLTNWQISQDASIVDLTNWQISQDASIVDLTNWQISQDASIVDLSNWQISQDASIDALRSKDASIDASLNVLFGWNVTQDSSIVDLRQDILDLDSSLDLFVLKAGDTMTGPLTISAGGLQVQNDVSILGKLLVSGNTDIGGDLTINGSLYVVNTGTLDVSIGFIKLNTGLTGVPPSTMQSGIVIERGSLEPYVFIFDETDKTFRIGVASETSTGYLDSSTQAVATRQDTPITDGVAVWNVTENRFDTYSSFTYDGSLHISNYGGGGNLMLIVDNTGLVQAVAIPNYDASIANIYTYIDGSLSARDTSIAYLNTQIQQLDASIVRIDGSINALFARQDTSVLGAINIGDGSAGVYAGITTDGSLQFREFVGANGINVLQSGDLISIAIDASFSGGEINTASNIGTGEGLSVSKEGVDLPFKSISTLNPSEVLITSDASTIYIDVSIAASSDASLGGLTDVLITPPLDAHQIIEWDSDVSLWVNTNNIAWDLSLGTTTDDLGGVPAGTDLNGLTLKQILYKILYEYQIPTLLTGTDPLSGIYEKGLAATQFASVDVSFYSTNFNFPLALLNNVHITKTGTGSIYDASLGLVATASGSYNDAAGITNWGGTSRTISYNVTIDDDQADQSQPAVGSSKSFTFYYRQFWGEVDGTVNAGTVDSILIHTLDSSRLAGETNLTATFDFPGGAKIKYLFAYPDTVSAPDNFGTLSQITDQNDFDITGSWDTGNVDVSIGLNNVRYRYYLLKNKVDTSTFDVTFKF